MSSMQWDAAGLLFMLFVTTMVALNEDSAGASWTAERLWLTAAMHLVPLLCMAVNLPW